MAVAKTSPRVRVMAKTIHELMEGAVLQAAHAAKGKGGTNP
jgi:hypothetical protein